MGEAMNNLDIATEIVDKLDANTTTREQRIGVVCVIVDRICQEIALDMEKVFLEPMTKKREELVERYKEHVAEISSVRQEHHKLIERHKERVAEMSRMFQALDIARHHITDFSVQMDMTKVLDYGPDATEGVSTDDPRLIGTFSPGTPSTFEQYLKSRSEEFQDGILGADRAQSWRDGGGFPGFVDGGDDTVKRPGGCSKAVTDYFDYIEAEVQRLRDWENHFAGTVEADLKADVKRLRDVLQDITGLTSEPLAVITAKAALKGKSNG